MGFSYLTLNVLNVINRKRYNQILKLINDSNYDLVALQEVTHLFLQMLLKDESIMKRYQIPSVCNDGDQVLESMLLIKWQLRPEFRIDRMVRHRNRVLTSAVFDSSNNGSHRVGVTTFHMQSEFFNEQATRTKAEQLLQIRSILNHLMEEKEALFCFCLGDANLTGGSWLKMENAALEVAGLRDVWLMLNSTDENQNRSEWREYHCTWDGGRNPLVRYRGEYHRPDRVLMVESEGFRPSRIKRITCDQNGNPYSDHYGLSGVMEIS